MDRRKKPVGFRTKRRLQRRRKFRRTAITIFICAVLLLIGVTFVYSQDWIKWPKLFNSKTPVKPISKTNQPQISDRLKAKMSCLIVGTNTENNREEAMELRLLVRKRSKDKLSVISIPSNMLVDIPGYGFEKIGQAFSAGGMPKMLSTIRNFLGVKIDYWIKLDYKDFKRLANQNNFTKMISTTDETNLSLNQRLQLAEEIGEVNLTDIEIFALPVKLITLNEITYADPDKEEISQLIAKIFNIKNKKREQITRVVVLNGSGVPGVAGQVAERLIQNGYKVIESKNADNFTYDVTQIINFGADSQTANKIRILVGTGIVIKRTPVQELADIAIIVGKDYQ